MASELSLKLKSRRELVESGSQKFESTQTPSKADCARISPRKIPKEEQGGIPKMIDCVKAEEQGGIPRVASPQQRTRRVSNPVKEFKDVMPKRRSLTDSKATHYEGTPGKLKKVDGSKEACPSPMQIADFELIGFSDEKPEEASVADLELIGLSEEKPEEKPDEVVDADHVDEQGDAHSPANGMVIPEDPACKVYVGNLSYKTRFQTLKTHMAKPELEIAFAGILGDDGSVDGYGWSRGFGFVIYETPEQAKAAIELLNGTELEGRKITVDFWSAEDAKEESGPKKTWGKENGKSWQKDDWKGRNWKSRNEDDWYWNMFAQMSGQRWGQSRQHQHPRSKRGDTKVRAWVGNVNHGADWKDLKNHMEPAGDVKWAECFSGAKSKGSGFVEYKTPEQVEQAVNSLNGTEMQGRQILVDHWTTRSSSKGR